MKVKNEIKIGDIFWFFGTYNIKVWEMKVTEITEIHVFLEFTNDSEKMLIRLFRETDDFYPNQDEKYSIGNILNSFHKKPWMEYGYLSKDKFFIYCKLHNGINTQKLMTIDKIKHYADEHLKAMDKLAEFEKQQKAVESRLRRIRNKRLQSQ